MNSATHSPERAKYQNEGCNPSEIMDVPLWKSCKDEIIEKGLSEEAMTAE
ncbi:hypothetical protein [Roseivirga ehrenbergii]|nr:hypothetical protein [Roseivirga ehrenbergii]